MNFLETLQQHFAFPPLKKIDPNTQEVLHDENETPGQKFAQAAIPAVLLGMRHMAASDAGAGLIASAPEKQDWVPLIFPNDSINVVQKVAEYSGYPIELTYEQMNKIAGETAARVKEQAGETDTILNIKQVLESQLTDILSYLPASLQLGKIFDNNTLDDRTHKMEGPVSGLMHAISSAFTNADEDEKKKKL